MNFSIDIFTLFSTFISLVFSFVAIIQTHKTNKLAKESLIEAKREHVPKLIFVSEVRCEKICYDEIKNKLLFDFADFLKDSTEASEDAWFVKAKIKNIGNGDANGLALNSFALYVGGCQYYGILGYTDCI